MLFDDYTISEQFAEVWLLGAVLEVMCVVTSLFASLLLMSRRKIYLDSESDPPKVPETLKSRLDDSDDEDAINALSPEIISFWTRYSKRQSFARQLWTAASLSVFFTSVIGAVA